MKQREYMMAKSKEEIGSIALKRGIVVPEGEKKEATIDRLIEVDAGRPQASGKKDAVKVAAGVMRYEHAQQAVLDAVSQFTAAGLTVDFVDDGHSVIFKAGAHEVGTTMHQPMELIFRSAGSAAEMMYAAEENSAEEIEMMKKILQMSRKPGNENG